MSLSEEGRKRIYEEEKIRAEAWDKVESDAKKKKLFLPRVIGYGFLGFMGLVIIMTLMGEPGKTPASTAPPSYPVDISSYRPDIKAKIEAALRESAIPKTHSFSGTGPKGLVGPFYLNKGVSDFTYSHSGESNFIVFLLDSNQDSVALILNEIGSGNGTANENLDRSGNYYFQVKHADGYWTLKVQ